MSLDSFDPKDREMVVMSVEGSLSLEDAITLRDSEGVIDPSLLGIEASDDLRRFIASFNMTLRTFTGEKRSRFLEVLVAHDGDDKTLKIGGQEREMYAALKIRELFLRLPSMEQDNFHAFAQASEEVREQVAAGLKRIQC